MNISAPLGAGVFVQLETLHCLIYFPGYGSPTTEVPEVTLYQPSWIAQNYRAGRADQSSFAGRVGAFLAAIRSRVMK